MEPRLKWRKASGNRVRNAIEISKIGWVTSKLVKAKFHYTIHVADLVADLVSDLSQVKLSRHEIARTWSQTGSGHILLRYPARELVADLLAIWSRAR